MIFLIVFGTAGIARLVMMVMDRADKQNSFKIDDDLSERYRNN
jgi:hypothetical protein